MFSSHCIDAVWTQWCAVVFVFVSGLEKTRLQSLVQPKYSSFLSASRVLSVESCSKFTVHLLFMSGGVAERFVLLCFCQRLIHWTNYYACKCSKLYEMKWNKYSIDFAESPLVMLENYSIFKALTFSWQILSYNCDRLNGHRNCSLVMLLTLWKEIN